MVDLLLINLSYANTEEWHCDYLNGSKKNNGLEPEVWIFAVVVIACGNMYVIFEFTLIEQFAGWGLGKIITNNSAAQPDRSLALKYPDAVPLHRRWIIF